MDDKGVGRSLPTDLHALVRDEAVDVEYFSTEGDLDGRIELLDGRPAIFVNTRGRSRDYPRVRFTLGHEVGHFYIFYMHRRLLRAGVRFKDDRIDLDQEARLDAVEREANDFAIEALLPTRVLKERFERTKLIDLSFIVKLATEANASLQATAIRVARETSNRIAVLLAERGQVEWIVVSDDWREAKLPAGQLKGKPLPAGSVAARLPRDFREERVALETWAPRQGWKDADVWESAVETPYGRLVFLAAAEAEEDEDEVRRDDED
jgi:hypothetical protein